MTDADIIVLQALAQVLVGCVIIFVCFGIGIVLLYFGEKAYRYLRYLLSPDMMKLRKFIKGKNVESKYVGTGLEKEYFLMKDGEKFSYDSRQGDFYQVGRRYTATNRILIPYKMRTYLLNFLEGQVEATKKRNEKTFINGLKD